MNIRGKLVKIRKKQGFTIIELIIAVAIIVILSGIVLANYHASRRQQTLTAEAQKLASTLRKAQNMALAGEVHKCEGDPEPKQHDYGAAVVTIAYPKWECRLFVDCNEDGSYNKFDPIGDPVIESTEGPELINFVPSGMPWVVFESPKGFPHPSTPTIRTFTFKLGTITKKVLVYKATGRIEIQ